MRPMIEKHLIYIQRSKKSREHYKRSYESGPVSWTSCLPLMSLSSHPGVLQQLLFEHHFKVRSGQLSSLQTNPVQGPLEVGINLRVNFPSVLLCMSQLRVPDKKSFHPGWKQSLKLCLFPVLTAGHEATDLCPKIDY